MTLTLSQGTAAGRGRRARGRVVAALAGAAVLCAGLVSGAGAAAASDGVAAKTGLHWGKAEPVPGLAALNKGYNASVNSLSCWAAGDCVAGGMYCDKHRHAQAFVALERKGRWDSAIQVPGTAALNSGGNAQVGSVSCARIGACVAVGTYTDRHKNKQWFTVIERTGRWGKAAPVPVPALNGASISTVWCAPGGLCAAGGSFTDQARTGQAWVMTQTFGHHRCACAFMMVCAVTTGPA